MVGENRKEEKKKKRKEGRKRLKRVTFALNQSLYSSCVPAAGGVLYFKAHHGETGNTQIYKLKEEEAGHQLHKDKTTRKIERGNKKELK